MMFQIFMYQLITTYNAAHCAGCQGAVLAPMLDMYPILCSMHAHSATTFSATNSIAMKSVLL